MREPTFQISYQKPPRLDIRTGKKDTKGLWEARLHPLRRTKSWAKVYGPLPSNKAGVLASNIKNGLYSGLEKGEFEAISRSLEDGSYLFVRFTGNDKRKVS